jgi:hypothetical protein
MDAKVHPARPVHHLDAEEMFCPVPRRHHQEAAVASVDRVADLVAAVHRNFQESSPAPGRDCRPSALADGEACSVALQAHPKPPRVASAGQALDVRAVPVARIAPVEKVVVHPDLGWSQELQVAEHPKEVPLAGAMARRVVVPVAAEPRELARLEPPMEPEFEPLGQLESLTEQERRVSLQQEREQQLMAEAQAPRALAV